MILNFGKWFCGVGEMIAETFCLSVEDVKLIHRLCNGMPGDLLAVDVISTVMVKPRGSSS